MRINRALSTKYLRNDQGTGMVEILVGSAIALLVLAAVSIIFTRNQSILKDENDGANISAKGRLAIEQLAEEIRMAGFGLPPSQGLTAIAASSLGFQSNLDDVRTTTPPCNPCVPGVSTGGSIGDGDIDVVDESGFSGGDNIVIYDPSFGTTETKVVNSVSTGHIDLTSNLTNSYLYGVNTNLVTVNKYNNVTIALSGTSIIKTVDGSATVLMNDVVATTGLAFNYYGAATPAAVKRVGITLNFVDPENPDAVIEFKTDVNLRNS